MLLGGLRALLARISVSATLAQSTPFGRAIAMNVCGGLLTVCCTLGPIVEQHARYWWSGLTVAIMGRMHSKGKGLSRSSLPYKRSPASWVKTTEGEVKDHITKLAKKGTLPSQIGVILRDSHGIAQVGAITGSKILRIMKGLGLAPEIPEDLYHLIKKAVSMRKHLELNRKDKDGKFRLILVESRIHRLARYYKKSKKLPPNWRYESATASALVA